MATSRKNAPRRSIRLLQDALVDETGARWERVRTDGYHLTPDELAARRPQASRFLTTGAYGAPVAAAAADDFDAALASAREHRVHLYRAATSSDLLLLVDTSDC